MTMIHTSRISHSRPWSLAIFSAASARAPGVSMFGGEFTRSRQRPTPDATALAASKLADS